MSTSARTGDELPEGYSWSGDLTEVRVNSLYAACHSLRFTGRLELRDHHNQAQVVFLGGEPVEIEGGDTHVIALWNTGRFRAVQSIPNLTGELTGQIEQTGSLSITKAPRLLAWVSEYRLSCDLAIERPGEKAELAFKFGQLEGASVNGKPELAALARVQAWPDGFYRVQLRPLFADGVIALQPPPLEGAAPEGREFDLSRSIPLDLKRKAALMTPPAGMLTVGPHAGQPVPVERRPPMPRLTSGTEPVTPISERYPAPRRGASWPYAVVGLLIAGAATMSTLYLLHLPPFSPPPRPLDEPHPVAKVEPTPPPVEAPKPTDTPVDKPADEPVHKPADEPAAKPSDEPDKPAEVDPAALEPKPAPGTESAALRTGAPDERMIEKGRLLLIDGHPHSALSLFRKAEQTNPKNALAKLLQQQALGKLGRAELSLEGKGHANIDGKAFDAPKKLHLFAGPHAVDSGAGPEELVLKKGEHRKLRLRP